jgi:2-polyprenyl-3-methyl-5-hydroxy-6-metoxy-1,4-benzoquinol methylase
MTYIDRRHTQTTDHYAVLDLETVQTARRYGDHVFRLFRPYIGRRVFEVGSGIGTMSERLVGVADVVVGIEPNPACAGRARQAMARRDRFTLHVCHLEECDVVELAAHRFDTVFCVNVLEHIADDGRALRIFREVVVPGGHVLVFVPAVQAAYGPLDAELGHHRRYSRRSLARAFAGADLALERIRYTNPIGLLGWLYNAHLARSRAHSPTQIKLFETLIAPWALPLERWVPPPIGLSLMAVGRKR